VAVPAHSSAVGDDAHTLARAYAARNGAKFGALWRGDWSGYPSQSEADQALCNHLAFWTQGDPAAIDRLFRRSGLYRDKWDTRRGDATYGSRTIATALGAYRPRGRGR
jgi:primase-polymerase (primpol)-like protein